MIKKISIKTKFGWISAFENKGRIFEIKFGKVQRTISKPGIKKVQKKLLEFELLWK